MKSNNMLSEQELREDREFALFMQQMLPNQSAPEGFTQQVMSKASMQPIPRANDPWYQSLGLWLILTGIFTVFAAFFGILFYLCDYSVLMMFHVIINYLEKFEIEIPSLGSLFVDFSSNKTLFFVLITLGSFVVIDGLISALKKKNYKKI